jgi:hypothetical protein
MNCLYSVETICRRPKAAGLLSSTVTVRVPHMNRLDYGQV